MKLSNENRKKSESHSVLEGNALYEIDDTCMKKKIHERKRSSMQKSRREQSGQARFSSRTPHS